WAEGASRGARTDAVEWLTADGASEDEGGGRSDAAQRETGHRGGPGDPAALVDRAAADRPGVRLLLAGAPGRPGRRLGRRGPRPGHPAHREGAVPERGEPAEPLVHPRAVARDTRRLPVRLPALPGDARRPGLAVPVPCRALPGRPHLADGVHLHRPDRLHPAADLPAPAAR